MSTFEFFACMRFLCPPRHNHINQFGLSKQGHA
jgi:hypothetical protein